MIPLLSIPFTAEGDTRMAQQDYSSIGPLDATATKEAWPLIGLVILVMVVTVIALFIVGNVANAL